MIMPPQDQKKTKSRTILVSGSCTWFGTIIDQMKLMWRLPQPFMLLSDIYTLFDGLAYNTCGYFASCVVFFRKNTSNEQNVRSYYMLNHRIRGLSFTLVPEVFLDFSSRKRSTASREAATTSCRRDEEKEKNLWLPWHRISLSCRRQGQDRTLGR